ncbi:type VI secretion system tube protein Hcp [Salmonella enterica]|nr:type VI secretion system tube protein Hcp [Salmonella enterica]
MDAIFLKLDNIKGESQVEGFEDQIEIMSYSHNVAMQVNNDVSLTERTSGRAHVGEMSLTKFVDLATPVLNEYCCSGRLIRTAVLTLCRNDGGKPVETMSLNFTKIEWQITAEKSDGAQQESRTSVWDLAMDQIGK